MDFGKEHDIIILGLKKLISDNGRNVFDEPRRARALISDYFPRLSNAEKNLLNISCECGIYKMIVHSTSYEDRNVYMRAKCLLIDDYMIAEQAAEITLERIYKACGKQVPNDISKNAHKDSKFTTAVAIDKTSYEKSNQQKSLATKDKLERKVSELTDGMKKYERLSKEPLNETQKIKLLSIMMQLASVQEQAKKIVNEGDNYFVLETQVEPLYKAIDSCVNEINALERDVLNNQPKEINSIVASMQICSRNTTFYIQTFLGPVSYITKACLSYNGKQYVVAQMPPANFNAVFVVCNNMLILDTDTNAVNYLVNYCQIKGLLN